MQPSVNLPEHFASRGMEEFHLLCHLKGEKCWAKILETEEVYIVSMMGHVEGVSHVGLGSQVVDFIWFTFGYGAEDEGRVSHVTEMQYDLSSL